MYVLYQRTTSDTRTFSTKFPSLRCNLCSSLGDRIRAQVNDTEDSLPHIKHDNLSSKPIMSEGPVKTDSTHESSDEKYSYLSVSTFCMLEGVAAIGAYFVGSDGKVQEKCFCRLIEEDDIRDYLESSSSKDDSTLRRMNTEAKKERINTEGDMTSSFCKFLDELEASHDNILIITDGFGDIPRIDDLMDRHCGRRGICYMRDGGSRDKANITERLSQTSTFSCLTGDSTVEVDMKLNFKATEYLLSLEDKDLTFNSWPPDQAHYLYVQYLASNMMKEAIMKNVDAISSSLDSLMIRKPAVREDVDGKKDRPRQTIGEGGTSISPGEKDGRESREKEEQISVSSEIRDKEDDSQNPEKDDVTRQRGTSVTRVISLLVVE